MYKVRLALVFVNIPKSKQATGFPNTVTTGERACLKVTLTKFINNNNAVV